MRLVSSSYFNDISTFLATYLRDTYGICIVQYVDDFLCLDRSCERCEFAQNCIINILRFVGFFVSWSKTQPPSQVLTFLGIEVDSIKMDFRLPLGKLTKLKIILLKHHSERLISKMNLEVLVNRPFGSLFYKN